ncbi:hypothetical protein DVR12_18075 [Chitinophaga silvatica]|uniref:Dienelactone hydrolase domain-containing protein n=1 Tax=Chitinophaga silvatica TaxID=2282649 RepID=A0A3E1Y6D3_9BACT|nr:prolyl oligopeptidase family serine peptidase [Chitinophaga silvatica]RFS20477.1 hypothetical protein DVR12_18075 [Chitinophaga silvatica]
MKILLFPCLLFCNLAFSQTYDELRASAASNLNKKDYCAALSDLKIAFTKKSKIGPYDYISGVSAAANCNDIPLALKWLKKSYDLGLGTNQEEISFLETNESFKNIFGTEAFLSVLKDMKLRLAESEKKKKEDAAAWNKEIVDHQIQAQVPFQKASEGFALYFTKVDELEVPYIVYVPKGYNPATSYPAIVFLHGGVVSVNEFFYKSSDVRKEPIFSIGEQFQSIIIYPFAKKDFGWVNQEKAFENVFTVVRMVEAKYNVNKERIYLGGMSNGGTAAFWFASQKETPFRAFYAFSANPILKIGAINFENITSKHPLYTIHSKDDEAFKYNEVARVYKENKSKAEGWKFETIKEGTHGFIYDPEIAAKLLSKFFSEVLK